jgi:hypothetical protein
MEGELVYSTATSSLWYVFMMQVGLFDNGGDYQDSENKTQVDTTDITACMYFMLCSLSQLL